MDGERFRTWSAAGTPGRPRLARALDDPYERLWQRTVDEMRQLLEQARNGIRAGALADDRAVLDGLGCFGRFKGAGTVTAAGAAYLAARHAAQPAQGVLRAAFERGADTDTLAAVTGGLLGCLAGEEWLPAAWRDVQDGAYMRCLAGRVARGPSGAEQQPVEIPIAPQSILTDLARNGDHEVLLGESTRVQATALPDLKPLTKSIAVRAWRLTTSEGQTMYVTKVDGLPRDAGSTKKGDELVPARGPSKPAQTSGRAAASRHATPGSDPASVLYVEFCRRARSILDAGAMKPKDVAKALDLVPGQASRWLKRATQDGMIEQVSTNPVRFALSRKSLL